MSLELNKKKLLYFLSSQAGVTYQEVGHRLKLSKRSIKLLIESLLYSYGHILAIQEVGDQLYLKLDDTEKFDLLMTGHLLQETDLTSFHKRQAIFFRRLLEAEGYLSADELAADLRISRRSLSRDMSRMKEVLARYQLSLESKTGVGVRLAGTELSKRLLYLYEVSDYLVLDEVVPGALLSVYEKAVASLPIPPDLQKILLATLKISWQRREFDLDSQAFTWFTPQTELRLTSLVDEVLPRYWQRSLTSSEINFLTFPLHLGLIDVTIERPDVLELVQAALAVTVQEYGVQLAIDHDAQLLQRHVIYLLNRSIFKWQFTELGLRAQLVKSSFSSIMAQFFIDRLSSQIQLPIAESETILISAWMELLVARKVKPIVSRIAVISQAGSSFNSLVGLQIQEVFGREVHIDFLEFANHASYERLEQRYDLIFADNLMYSRDLFDPFLSLTLITQENRAEKERIEQTVLARKIQLYCQVIQVPLDEDLSYEDNLAALGQRLALEEFDFDQLLERERQKPSISETGFAYPHRTSENLEQIYIVVAEQDDLQLKSRAGLLVTDFILLLIPHQLDDFQQDLLYNIFDNTFRTDQGTVKERLGLAFMTEIKKR